MIHDWVESTLSPGRGMLARHGSRAWWHGVVTGHGGRVGWQGRLAWYDGTARCHCMMAWLRLRGKMM